MSDPLIPVLEDKFDCRVLSFKRKRKVFLCHTNKGDWVVKGYSNPVKIDWLLQLTEQLYGKGFRTTIQYLTTAQGEPYFSHGRSYYTVMKKIAGRDASYQRRQDLKQTVSCLARFHRVAKGVEGGFASTTDSIPLLGKWQRRTSRFEKIVFDLRKKSKKNQLERAIIQLAPSVLNDAYEVMDILSRSPMEEKVKQAIAEKRVAHRDLASHNFLIHPEGDCYFIDYDTAMYDSPLVDVIQMMSRIMVMQHWSFPVYADLLETYRKLAPLSEEEASLLYVLLRYPDDILREVNGCYDGKSGFRTKNVQFLLRKIKKDGSQRQAFFQGVEHFISV